MKRGARYVLWAGARQLLGERRRHELHTHCKNDKTAVMRTVIGTAPDSATTSNTNGDMRGTQTSAMLISAAVALTHCKWLSVPPRAARSAMPRPSRPLAVDVARSDRFSAVTMESKPCSEALHRSVVTTVCRWRYLATQARRRAHSPHDWCSHQRTNRVICAAVADITTSEAYFASHRAVMREREPLVHQQWITILHRTARTR
jgi:hypothetical protein